jgi:vacuolar-type H+-ATPase subunit F/Vma7
MGYLYAAKFSETLNQITGTTTQTDIVDIIVLATDKANTINDTKSYTFGYNSAVNSAVITKALTDLGIDNNTLIPTKEYTDWDNLITSLYTNKDIQAIAVTESVRATLADQYQDFTSRTKVIGSIKITTEVKLSASDKKVNEEPFIIYLSGNDEYGSVSSTGRSDVNILAVINPKTRQILLVSTPRDSYIKISNGNGVTGLDKLTHAGNAGVECSISALENLYV